MKVHNQIHNKKKIDLNILISMPMFDEDIVGDDDNGFFFRYRWTIKDGKLYFSLGF